MLINMSIATAITFFSKLLFLSSFVLFFVFLILVWVKHKTEEF